MVIKNLHHTCWLSLENTLTPVVAAHIYLECLFWLNLQRWNTLKQLKIIHYLIFSQFLFHFDMWLWKMSTFFCLSCNFPSKKSWIQIWIGPTLGIIPCKSAHNYFWVTDWQIQSKFDILSIHIGPDDGDYDADPFYIAYWWLYIRKCQWSDMKAAPPSGFMCVCI